MSDPMTGTELIRLAFEEHWVFMTVLCPGTTVVYTFLTGKWSWCFVAWIWHEAMGWGKTQSIASAVAERMNR